MYLGIDLGTSAVKVLLVDADERVLDEQSVALEQSRPKPGWSEQDPESWWRATCDAVAALEQRDAVRLAGVRAIGLSGQMHGATLLDDRDQPLRPAILWNDGRNQRECAELERAVPDARAITGNRAMPGFTAPMLLWVRRHETAIAKRVRSVLLPKDYLRLRMTGEKASDVSDSSGTLWLDVAKRRWSDAMLDACGLDERAMPQLFEGPEATASLLPEVARRWGVGSVPVAAGAGDQAAGAIGAGVIGPGEASLSLGTSGVYFVAGDRFRPNPEGAVHAFCHGLPGRWHQMSVILSAASCLSWVAALTGARDETTLLAEVEARDRPCERLLFLPYLSGERTPHDDPHARGVFFGMDHDTDRAALARAVLEGVAFALADAQDALGLHDEVAPAIGELSVIGGGARSALWGRIIASVLDRTLLYREGGAIGPALGAARLARMSQTREAPTEVCIAPRVLHEAAPEAWLRDHYAERLPVFRRLYHSLQPHFGSEGERLSTAGKQHQRGTRT